MRREQINTQSAPAPIGPYSQAVACGDLIFASGQVALDPASGEFLAGDIESQTRRALDNLSAVLRAANSSLGQVIKTTVFLTSMANFAAMNAVYGEYFASEPPARSTIGVAELPKNALVEIEVIATRQTA
jgi:2-iminobutanoate/2-iminopropanoate deaminase